jgi:hypothetical protein
MTPEHLAALSDAALKQTAEREGTGVSYAFGDKEQTFRAELVNAYRAGQIAVIGPDVVATVVRELDRAIERIMGIEIEAMAGDVIFDKKLQRTINVDIRYVLWVIEKFSNAKVIVDEMDIIK